MNENLSNCTIDAMCSRDWLLNAYENWFYLMGLIFSIDSLNQAFSIYMSIVILYLDLINYAMHSGL